MPVQVDVVKEVLVDRIVEDVLARLPANPRAAAASALRADLALGVTDGGPLDLRMRDVGYLSRVVEGEMFEPARAAATELLGDFSHRIASGVGWAFAARAVCLELARSEPLPKPSPDDHRAVSWKVPGPGGHVRHYVVAAAIAELLSEGDEGRIAHTLPVGIADAGELKRCWTYGFMVRCCEEVVPPEHPEA